MEQARPEPTTRGALGKTPLAHLLVYSLERKLRGTFELSPPAEEGAAPGSWMLLVHDGRPAKARVAAPVPYLGRLLLERGYLTQEQLDATLLDLAKTRRLHGQILLERGMVSPDTLQTALAEQLLRKVDALFDLPPETTFSYYADWDGLAQWGGPAEATVDPLTVLWRGITRLPSWDHVHIALARLGQARVRIAKDAQLDRLALDETSRRVIDVLRAKPMRSAELFALEMVPAKTAQLLLYLLAITKQITLLGDEESAEPSSSSSVGRTGEPPSSSAVRTVPPDSPSSAALGRMSFAKRAVGAVEEEHIATGRDARRATPVPGETPLRRPTGAVDVRRTQPSAGAVPQAPRSGAHLPPVITPKSGAHAPPRTTPGSGAQVPPVLAAPKAAPNLDARRQEIAARFAQLDTVSHWDVLGVPVDAPVDAVRAAYFQLAKAWHPDRVPAELADVRPQVVKVFARMNEAYATLADEKKRAEYKEKSGSAAGEAEEQAIVQRVLEATLAFQKGEILFKRGDLAQAEPLLQRAVELDDTQADYLALLTWIHATKPGAATTPEATQTHIAALDRAIAIGPRCERAYFFRGMLRKRLGDGAKALADFRSVCELNPRNVDAQRELRLLEMRGGKSVPPPAPEGEGGGLLGRFFKK